MKQLFGFLIISVILTCIAVAVGAQSSAIYGTIHAHSVYSDGDRTPKMFRNAAKAVGDGFFIITDHGDQIDKLTSQKKATGKFVGFDRYFNDFTAGKPFGICGVELQIGTSHLLVFGEREKMALFVKADFGSLKLTIVQAKKMGLLTVAAHPFSKDYPFDTVEGSEVDGVEFYNDGSIDGYKKTLAWYLSLLKAGRDVFVIAGCDTHASVDPTQLDLDRWSRRTGIYFHYNKDNAVFRNWVNNGLDCQSLLLAFRRGSSFAVHGDIGFRADSAVDPLFEYVKWGTPDGYSAYLYPRFSKPLKKAVKIRVYFDGVLDKASEQTIPKGTKSYDYKFVSTKPILGRHWWVMEIEGLFISSPKRGDFYRTDPWGNDLN